jgi:mRNA interferase MazF
MVTPSVGAVILVTFPFSDLSQAKLRPAVVLADVGRNDWILCQITSNPYGDSKAITLTDNSFAQGSLPVTSYARPGKLFTSNSTLMVKQVGCLRKSELKIILLTVIGIFQAGIET